MPGNSRQSLTANPLDLTGQDITEISVQCMGASMFLTVTADAVAPSVGEGGLRLIDGQALNSTTALSEYFPGVQDPKRVWAWTDVERFSVSAFVSWS